MTFSWEKFDLAFLKEIIKATDDVEDTDLYLRSNDKDIVVSCVNMICDHPDKKFVMKYRQIIEQYVLVNYPEEVKNICKSLNISSRSFNEKQSMMTKKAMSASLINAYVAALLNISGMTIYPSEYSSFRYTRSLNMAETKIEEIPLYDFQRTAVNSLKEHFITNDEKSGLLVMPTGSGKSRTATYFLISEMVSRGYQVIWLAHRYMLLDQAADCFYRFAGLSKVRGISAHGTESVYIVDFHDKWTVFNRWLNPEWVLSDEDSDVDPKLTRERKKQIYREYEWEMCRDQFCAELKGCTT